jgi:hypothetical protein
MSPRVPAVVIPTDPPDNMLTVGIPAMTFDGEPFPFETMENWTLTFSEHGAAMLTLSMPVRLASKDEDD